MRRKDLDDARNDMMVFYGIKELPCKRCDICGGLFNEDRKCDCEDLEPSDISEVSGQDFDDMVIEEEEKREGAAEDAYWDMRIDEALGK